MSATQLEFTLRTSNNVKTVHLLGSWDKYEGQLPLSKNASKPGSWKGLFRFQTSTLIPGQRYWYYYIMDGFHVSHDPAKPSTTEPTTGRQLNVLDVPGSSSSYSGQQRAREVPVGRAISPSKIISPKPTKAYASRGIREADYTMSPVGDITDSMEQVSLYSKYSGSPTSSIETGSSSSVSSRSDRSGGSRRSGGTSPSSLSSLSDRSGSSCRCNRYGITRNGDRVKMDCGGTRCGYGSDSSSACSSDSEGASRASSGSGPASGSSSASSSASAPASKAQAKYVEIKPRQTAPAPKRRR